MLIIISEIIRTVIILYLLYKVNKNDKNRKKLIQVLIKACEKSSIKDDKKNYDFPNIPGSNTK